MHNSNITKLFWANLFINFFWLSAVITFFYLERGLNYTQILSLGAISSLAVLIFQVPAGVFADKFGRKKSLIISVALFLLAIITYLFAQGFASFALADFLMGVAISFSPGAEALLYDSLKADRKENNMKAAIGKYLSAQVLAGVITPPIAAFIARDLLPVQFNILIYLTIISYVIALFIIFSLKEVVVADKTSKHHYFLHNLKLLKHNGKLLVLIFNRAFVMTALLSYLYLWQPQFQLANVPVKFFGFFRAVGSLGLFTVNRNIERIHSILGSKKAFFFSSVIPALGFIALAFVLNPIISVLLYLGIRIIAAIREPLFSELINKELPSNQRATLLSLISIIASVLTLVLRPVIGRVADISLSYGFMALGVLCLVSVFLFPIRKHHLLT